MSNSLDAVLAQYEKEQTKWWFHKTTNDIRRKNETISFHYVTKRNKIKEKKELESYQHKMVHHHLKKYSFHNTQVQGRWTENL